MKHISQGMYMEIVDPSDDHIVCTWRDAIGRRKIAWGDHESVVDSKLRNFRRG
jgi:hypothetical protein